MGISGHKHHYNEANLEKQMKGIGDTVCLINKKQNKNIHNCFFSLIK